MKTGMISLGCDKNRVDSERMLYALKNAGYTLVSDAEDAEIMIINTCAFIDSAKTEAVDTILECAALKEKNLRYLVVTGCFAQRYADMADLPEVDLFVDIPSEKNIVALLDELTGFASRPCFEDGRILTTPAHYAYLKIADGCDNRCSYCAIPSIRGPYLSFPMEKLVGEAETLLKEGVKELILVAQDTTAYGKDLYGKPSLVKLLSELVKLDFWKIRILYAYPHLIDEELLSFIKDNPKIAKYLDVPLQHADGELLKKMNRRDRTVKETVKKIRAALPDISLRSSFIVGFPGETEESHRVLLDFLADGVDYGGFFAFSPEEGTPAYSMRPLPSRRTVKKRIAECEDAQTRFTLLRQRRFVGRTIEVLYEGIDYDRQLFYGRSEYSAPDIDTLVYFSSDFPLMVGNVYPVEITDSDFHLYGKTVKEEL